MHISVVVVDDSQLMRNAIASLLKNYPEIDLVGVADSFTEALRLVGELRPNLVLMDLHMKDEGVVALSDCKSRLNGTTLLAMSLWNDEETKALAESLGAVQLLDKVSLAVELIPAIRKYAKKDGFETAHG